MLLMGLLRDAIEPAEDRADEISKCVVNAAQAIEEADEVSTMTRALRGWAGKAPLNQSVLLHALDDLAEITSPERMISLGLVAASLGIEIASIHQQLVSTIPEPARRSLYSSLMGQSPGNKISEEYINRLVEFGDIWTTTSPTCNAASVLVLLLCGILDEERLPGLLFHRELIALTGLGPYRDNMWNLLAIAAADGNPFVEARQALTHAEAMDNNKLPPIPETPRREILSEVMTTIWPVPVDRVDVPTGLPGSISRNGRAAPHIRRRLTRKLKDIFDREFSNSQKEYHPMSNKELELIKKQFVDRLHETTNTYWNLIRGTDVFNDMFVSVIESGLQLRPSGLWREAIRVSVVGHFPRLIAHYLSNEFLDKLLGRMRDGIASAQDIEITAWLLLVDIWVWDHFGYYQAEHSPFRDLADVGREYRKPQIVFANSARDFTHGRISVNEFQRTLWDDEAGVYTMLIESGWPTPRKRRAKARKTKPSSRSETEAIS
jgi:hypothetical protein